MKKGKHIVFLYTELAEYFISSLRYTITHSDTKILVVHWPINKEAPFKFDFPNEIEFIQKDSVSLEQLQTKISQFAPETIVCSGWIDKDYLQICKRLKKETTTVVAFDNHWTGSFKQRILKLFSPFYLTNIFKKAWVPGKAQKEYASKLGFKSISENFYAPDTSYYKSFSHKNTIPHVFLFMGRYLKHKGIFDLWNAFIELKKEQPNDWKLYCVGTGDEFGNKIEHPDITHYGFIQPKELGEILNSSGVYILPSTFEPWGVAVHEMASAGFPLLLSNVVGSKDVFLKKDNGFEFLSNNKESLKTAMKKVLALSDEELKNMSQKSTVYSERITQEMWMNTLLNF